MRFLFPLFVFFIFAFRSSAFTQTFSGAGGSIPDNGTDVFFPITVSGLNPQNIDTVFGLETICIDATHTWDSDLDIRLLAPDGTEIILVASAGNDGDDFTNTCFNSNANTSVLQASAPFTGTFKPIGTLGNINNNQNGNGIWQLHILDTYAFADSGSLINWNITFGNNPAKPFYFLSSNLPLIVINTNGQTIVDEPKIVAGMGIIYNGIGVRNYRTDTFNNYSGKIAIEYRGSSSQMFPKKPFGFETLDSNEIETDAPLLGMPAESDWILSPSYSDKSLMRNVLAYKLFNEMGHYASRTQYCELLLNGEYQGVYILMEKIKRGNNRVNIAKLDADDISGDSLTGGYIVKIDKQTGNGGSGWTSPFPPVINSNGQTIFFQYEYPSETAINPQQKQYIINYLDSFETALASSDFIDSLKGYRNFIGVNSFLDYFILNEVSKNIDGYRLSTFLHKDKSGKLKIGPPWDYDIAFYNANYCDAFSETGWAYEFGNVCPDDGWQIPFWWQRFLQDTAFANQLKCRWDYLRNDVLHIDSLHQWLNSTATYLDEGQQRNFSLWQILGAYVWPNPITPPTYAGEVYQLKLWLKNRILWLDDNIAGNCPVTGMEENTPDEYFSVYPNPNNGKFQLAIGSRQSAIKQFNNLTIYNILGELVYFKQLIPNNEQPDIYRMTTNLPNGIYHVSISANNKTEIKKIAVMKE